MLPRASLPNTWAGGAAAFALLLVGLHVPPAVAAAATPSAGAVIWGVRGGSAAEKAGIRTGDVLVAWSGFDGAGPVDTVFDSMSVEEEEAPRGPVTLTLQRDGETLTTRLDSEPWGLRTRPLLSGGILDAFERGRQAADAGDAGSQLAAWTEAARLAEAEGDAARAFWFVLRGAEILRRARKPREALALHERLLALAQAANDGTLTARAWTTNGGAYEELNELLAAEAGYRAAAEAWAAVRPGSLMLARNWHNVGVIATMRDDLDAAAEAHRRALALREARAPGRLAVALSLGVLGNVAMQRHDFVAAEQYQRRALAIREVQAPGSRELAWNFGNLGIIASRRGDLAGAEEFYRQTQEILAREDPGSLDIARVLNNRGVVALERGDLIAASELFRGGLAIRERAVPDSLDVASSLDNLSAVALDRGDLDEAEALAQRTLALRERIAPGSIGVGSALNNLGQVAYERGDYAASAERRQRALAIWEKIAPESLHVCDGLASLAEVYEAQGRQQEAEGLLRRAAEIQAKIAPASVGAARITNLLGRLALARRDWKGAEADFESAAGVLARLAPGTEAEASALHGLGLARLGRGDQASASVPLCRAVDAIERQRTRLGGRSESRAAVSARYGDFYHDCMRVLVAQGRAADAFHVLERFKAKELLTLLAERELLFPQDLPNDVAREMNRLDHEYDRAQVALAGLNPEREAAEVEKTLGRLRELRAQAEEMRAQIAKLSPRLASLRYPAPLDAAGARALLDPGTLLLSWSVGAAETLLFVLAADSTEIQALTLPLKRDGLANRITAFTASIAARREDTTALGRALYRDLVRPATVRIASARRVLLSPDGPLHRLPFAALARDDGPGRLARPSYFVEWKPLHSVLSATVYGELQRRRPAPRGAPPSTLAAFGDPSYPGGAGGTLRDAELRSAASRGLALHALPGTRREVEAIARLFPGRSQVFLAEAATEESVRSLGADVRFLHLACHGIFDSRMPMNSSLALSVPAAGPEAHENGLLQAWEIIERLRLEVDLATLSACETAVGGEMGGEGLIGLTRAFLYAGARSVLSSLWKVEDESTSTLMSHLYRQLRAGRPKDEALRAAQLELLRGGARAGGRSRGIGGLAARGGSLRHPFYWAAFQLSGDWK